MEQPRSLTLPATVFCLVLALGLGALAWWLGPDARDAIADREERGRVVRVIDIVHTVTWWVSLAGAGILLLAAATARWWAGPREGLGQRAVPALPPPGLRWWLGAAAVLLVAAWIRAERLDLSLYNDEAYMFRRYVAGDFRPDRETGELRHRVPDWAVTAWHMEVGNNSPPYSLLARLSYEQVAARAGLALAEVHEPSVRWPAYAAGLAGLLALALVARGLGSPDRGMLVLIAGAFHPWMIRYASEGRGHALLLLFAPLLLAALWRALASGLWRWWLAVAALSMLMMWTFPGAVHALLMLNLVLAAGWFFQWRQRPDGREAAAIQVPRWLLANGLAALAFSVLFAPMLQQMRKNLGEVGSLKGAPGWSWWVDIGSRLAVGMPWHEDNPDSPVASSVARALELNNWLPVAALGAVALVLALGWLWWCSQTRFGWLLAALGLGGPALAFVAAHLTDTVLHPWYVLISLPPLLLLAAGSLGWLQDMSGRVPRLGWWGAGLVLALWLATAGPVMLRELNNPVQPQREAVLKARGAVYPGYLDAGRQVLLAAFNTDSGVYDPFLTVTWSVTELEATEAEARRQGVPLYVTFAHRSMARSTHPALVDYIESSGRYELVRELHGTGHQQFNHRIFRWLGGEVDQ